MYSGGEILGFAFLELVGRVRDVSERERIVVLSIFEMRQVLQHGQPGALMKGRLNLLTKVDSPKDFDAEDLLNCAELTHAQAV